jgi:hypothetical protein
LNLLLFVEGFGTICCLIHFCNLSLNLKGWDDPSIVAGRETYQDWKHVQGLSLVGCTSFFPHMEDHWQSVVNDRTKELIEYLDYENEGGSSYDFKLLPTVCCLSDEQACLVEGEKQSIQVVSMVPQMVS